MRIVFMGTPDFSVPILNKLIADPALSVVCVVTQPDRPKGRKHRLTPPPVKLAALSHSIPVLQPEKVRDRKAIEEILVHRPDLLITAAYGQILTQPLLDGPPLGCINVHASLLPEYRGAAPIQQAIIDGKKETGVTIMYMVRKLDAGDILAQIRVPIGPGDTFGSLHDRLSEAGSRILIKTLPKLADHSVRPIAQDESRVTFVSQIRHEDEEIQWGKSASAIRNLIRGLNPSPGAFTLLDGRVFKIFMAELTDRHTEAAPGEIITIESGRLFVAAGSGEVLEITECQPFGRKRMNVTDFLNGSGRGLKTGTQLGGGK